MQVLHDKEPALAGVFPICCVHVGFTVILMYGGAQVRLVVMGNVFQTEAILHRKFDLKGSTHGRTAGAKVADPTAILKARPGRGVAAGVCARMCNVLSCLRVLQPSCFLRCSYLFLDLPMRGLRTRCSHRNFQSQQCSPEVVQVCGRGCRPLPA